MGSTGRASRELAATSRQRRTRLSDTAGVSGAVGVYVFVRGGDNALYVGRFVGGVWQGFQPLGGALTSFPVATATSTGLWVSVRGGDGALYARHLSAGVWSPWQGYGGYLNSAPWLAADTSGVYAFVAGGDDALYVRNLSGGTGWQPLGGFVAGPPTAVADATGISVFVQGGDGARLCAAPQWRDLGALPEARRIRHLGCVPRR